MLIRNPNSVEALARLDVVCFDKTGTLSENRLKVKRVRPIRGRSRESVIAAAASTIVARDGKADHATDEAIRLRSRHRSISTGGTPIFRFSPAGRSPRRCAAPD